MHGILFNITINANQSRSVGVYRIAHFLREQGADIEVIDWVTFWTSNELKELFKSRYNTKLKFIGFSHMFSVWNPVLEEFCEWVKKTYPEIKIISGSSSIPWFHSKYIDFYVMGFGEHATVELVKYICGNGTRPRFSMTLANGKPLIDANASYTAYPMQSLMVKYEDRDFIQPHEWLAIEFARGCKFQCDFCNFPVLGVKGDYSRDAKDAELQLRDAYDRFGVTNYIVADETFNDRTEKITKFANVVDALPFKPWFSGFIRADLMHSRALDLPELARMNFFGHYYGIESFNRPSAKAVGKGLDPEKIKQTLINTKSYFKDIGKPYRGTISLIIGLPHEPLESIDRTAQWLIDNWQEQSFMAYVMTIPLSDNSIKSLISKDYKKYGYRELTDHEIQTLKIDQRLLSETSSQGGDLLWANDYMDIFQANNMCKKLVDLKNIHDFRVDNFHLGAKSSISTIEDRTKVSFDVFKKSLITDISQYVNRKLNI